MRHRTNFIQQNVLKLEVHRRPNLVPGSGPRRNGRRDDVRSVGSGGFGVGDVRRRAGRSLRRPGFREIAGTRAAGRPARTRAGPARTGPAVRVRAAAAAPGWRGRGTGGRRRPAPGPARGPRRGSSPARRHLARLPRRPRAPACLTAADDGSTARRLARPRITTEPAGRGRHMAAAVPRPARRGGPAAPVPPARRAPPALEEAGGDPAGAVRAASACLEDPGASVRRRRLGPLRVVRGRPCAAGRAAAGAAAGPRGARGRGAPGRSRRGRPASAAPIGRARTNRA